MSASEDPNMLWLLMLVLAGLGIFLLLTFIIGVSIVFSLILKLVLLPLRILWAIVKGIFGLL